MFFNLYIRLMLTATVSFNVDNWHLNFTTTQTINSLLASFSDIIRGFQIVLHVRTWAEVKDKNLLDVLLARGKRDDRWKLVRMLNQRINLYMIFFHLSIHVNRVWSVSLFIMANAHIDIWRAEYNLIITLKMLNTSFILE